MDLIVSGTRNGEGIFAGRDYAPGEMLYEVTGAFISGDEDEDIDERTRANAFRYDEDRYISPAGTIGDFQNHSCAPNARVVKKADRLFVEALAHIRRGDEVLIDYSTITAADDIWEMDCNCASGACRGVVRSFDMLPEDLRDRYIREAIVPAFIVRL